MARAAEWKLDTDRYRLVYWIAVGAPGWQEGMDPREVAESVDLPSWEEWLPDRPLVPEAPYRPGLEKVLGPLSLEELLPGYRDEREAMAVKSGLFLINDFLDDAHRLAQRADNRTAAYWHGIMHRREPDYDNARYWFRRVGDHPLFTALGEAALEVAEAKAPVSGGRWDPFRFIDWCERLGRRSSGAEVQLARRLQGVEMKLLLAFSVASACG